jgi:S1-C subfamily serine protease
MLGVVSLSLAEVGKFTLAIPACSASEMLASIEKTGRYSGRNPRAWIGITCYPVGPNVIVAAVLPDSPAEASGLSSGDVVAAVDGIDTTDRRKLYGAIWSKPPGSTLRLQVQRGEETLEMSIVSGSIEEFFEG